MPQSGAPADGAAAEPTSAATTPSAPAKASYLFSRPRDTSQPTRFLFCNLGPGAGLCEQAISALFAPFGAVEQVIVPSATSFFSFVVFERAEHATAALQALHGQPSPGHGSHALTIKYAIGKEQQQQQVTLRAWPLKNWHAGACLMSVAAAEPCRFCCCRRSYHQTRPAHSHRCA